MNISRHIGSSSTEQMELILDFITNFDVNQLLYAINGKRLNEEAIENLILDINEQHHKLQRQEQYLLRFGKTFNKQFTTDDNHCYDSANKVARKIRSGTKCIKDIFKRFCKVSRKQQPKGVEEPQSIHLSLISSKYYSGELFGMSSYPECVRRLFEEMLEFYGTLDECIHEAMRQLKEEKEIRNNTRLTIKLLKEACEKSRKDQSHIIEAIEENMKLKEEMMKTASLAPNEQNPVLKDWENCETEESFATKYFHNCSPKDIRKITLHKVLKQSEEYPDLATCLFIFGCDKKKGINILTAIREFDNYLPENCKRKKIPAMHLYVFMKWCSQNIGYERFLNFFNKRYKSAGGKWGVIQKSALSGVSTKQQTRRQQFEVIEKDMLNNLTRRFRDLDQEKNA